MTRLKPLLGALVLGLTTQNVQASDVARAVYHVDFADAGRYSLTLTSVNNMLNAWEQELRDYDVEIVFAGSGLRFVTDDKRAGSDKALEDKREELKGRLKALNTVRGVKLSACNNTAAEFGLSQEALYPGVTLVPSGVAHLADRQAQGAAYLKIQ